ncbi:hypothetical protein NHH03_08635 [Stieleria sp. TO1_6]|nr:hypothetical protein [Stieleria tagensis]
MELDVLIRKRAEQSTLDVPVASDPQNHCADTQHAKKYGTYQTQNAKEPEEASRPHFHNRVEKNQAGE